MAPDYSTSYLTPTPSTVYCSDSTVTYTTGNIVRNDSTTISITQCSYSNTNTVQYSYTVKPKKKVIKKLPDYGSIVSYMNTLNKQNYKAYSMKLYRNNKPVYKPREPRRYEADINRRASMPGTRNQLR